MKPKATAGNRQRKGAGQDWAAEGPQGFLLPHLLRAAATGQGLWLHCYVSRIVGSCCLCSGHAPSACSRGACTRLHTALHTCLRANTGTGDVHLFPWGGSDLLRLSSR